MSDTVFTRVVALVEQIAGDAEVLGFAITNETTFHEDLRLESIDLVALAGMLEESFGPEVNLAAHLAELELDDVIALTVGEIVDYVSSAAVPGTRS